MAISVSYAPKTNKIVVLLSTMHNKEEINTDSEKKPLMILDYSATKDVVDIFDVKVNWSIPTRTQGQPDPSSQWDFSSSSWMLPLWMLPLFGLWPIQRGNAESHKRRSFLSAVAYDMIMSAIFKAMLAIGVEPVASTSAATGSKKRGRCRSCPQSQE